jgi:hypothetical protein
MLAGGPHGSFAIRHSLHFGVRVFGVSLFEMICRNLTSSGTWCAPMNKSSASGNSKHRNLLLKVGLVQSKLDTF